MTRARYLLTALLLLGVLAFWPSHADSKQYFDATLRFQPRNGTIWNYQTYCTLIGDEIQAHKMDRIGGIIWTIYDEEITSSGQGLVGATVRYHIYEAWDLSYASQYEKPGGGPTAPPDYSAPYPDEDLDLEYPPFPGRFDEPLQSIGGGGGGAGGGGTGGGDEEEELLGEGDFDIAPIMESEITYIISESGRLLNLSGMEFIGEIVDPSRSISVRQVFQTTHLVVLPDYEVHINESWRAPMSWTIPLVGETMEIPLTFTLKDIRTTYRFRVAAIDYYGVLQFDVDVSDEARLTRDGVYTTWRKESNIKGDVIIMGRAYVDLDRGILVGVCDAPALGNAYFLNHQRRGHEWWMRSDIGVPGSLNPGFYASLNFERRDLYTPLGNVLDPRQDLIYKIQELQWFTTTIVE